MSIRIPTQKRSIEKRDRIIKMGFELMCNEGYYNVSTNDIAKYADVSTGIIYQYFNDKKEIFIEGYKEYSNSIMFPVLDIINSSKINFNNLEELLSDMINLFIEKHTLSKKAHEEMIALSHLDSDIADIYHENEINVTSNVVSVLLSNGINCDNLFEKVHIIIGIVENYCHEAVYHKHESINYDIMKNEVISTVCYLLHKKRY